MGKYGILILLCIIYVISSVNANINEGSKVGVDDAANSLNNTSNADANADVAKSLINNATNGGSQGVQNDTNSSDAREALKGACIGAKNEITRALEQSDTVKAAGNDPRSAEALEICKEVIGFSTKDLDRVIDSISFLNNSNIDDFIEDLRVWTGGVISYLDICNEAFDNSTGDTGAKMRDLLKTSREMASNALNIITSVKTILLTLKIPGIDLSAFGITNRRLLDGGQQWVAGEIPAWINDPKRSVMKAPLNEIKPDVVVPTGQKTIADALKAVPANNVAPFIIYIKEGVYKENIEITKEQMNVVLVGDGATKTIITGNKNFADGVPTFKTSTVSALGDGFMARDIGFQNTAGAKGDQAVALSVASDLAIIYNCVMDGFQGTLNAVRGRQFYRDCNITGSIDLIFGDALAVFQKCEMLIRKPEPGQRCTVTAQSRSEVNGPGGFVLQGCKITGEKDFMAISATEPAFLGRPWKEYSRTIVMTSFIDQAIAPQGWTEWNGDFALKTLDYGEFDNNGPGADLAQRVKWPGLKVLTPQEADTFTPGKLFVTGDRWIPQSGVPYAPGDCKA